MARSHRKLFDDKEACCYHLVSRCVRGALLSGRHPYTHHDCSHRKAWVAARLVSLADSFGLKVLGRAVMTDHFHIVVHYDPRACIWWADEDVARRWVEVFPPALGGLLRSRTTSAQDLLLAQPERLARARRSLGSLSEFMRYLKQPISRRANLEDQTGGHFFEAGFYAGALLSEQAVGAAMRYVDLEPVLPMLDRWLEVCRGSTLGQGVRENSADALERYLPRSSRVMTRPR